MKTVLIIHGIGGQAGIHWQQWLNDELAKRNYKVLMPSLPDSGHPDRQTWLREIKATLKGVEPAELTIVSHSLGVTTALDFIEQSDAEINGLLAVSGFAEDYGSEPNSYFLQEKPVDFDRIRTSLSWVAVVYGDNDPYVPQDALKYVAESLGVPPLVIPNGGHLNAEAGYNRFPELLEMLL